MPLPRPQLEKHIAQFVSGAFAISLLKRTEQALRLHADMKRVGLYDPTGKFVKRLQIGEYIKQEKTQRRRVKIYLPRNPRFRPRADANRLLVHQLAFEFARATQKPVTLNFEGSSPSPFERFARPLLCIAGVFRGHRWLLKNHLNERKIVSKTFWP